MPRPEAGKGVMCMDMILYSISIEKWLKKKRGKEGMEDPGIKTKSLYY